MRARLAVFTASRNARGCGACLRHTAFMASRTRAEELAAAETIARVLGVELPVPSDINGQADLTFTDLDGCSGAVEVTFLTDAEIKMANDAWMAERARAHHAGTLRHSWTVTVEIRETTFKQLAARVEPHLAVLEECGIAGPPVELTSTV